MQKRPKLKDIPIVADDLNSVLDMSIRSLKMGRPAKFEESEQGLQDFKEASISYLEYVRETNNNPDNENHLIPDIESWATFIGTTRMTIINYEKSRGQDWKDFIALIKGAITACKKQLAFRQKIPTVLALFDLTNNSDYVNSSEFKLKPEVFEPTRALSDAELPRLGQTTQSHTELLPQLKNMQEVEE